MCEMPKRFTTDKLFDRRLKLGGGLDFRLIERPGLTMGDSELSALVDGLRAVADRGVTGGKLRYGILSGDRSLLADALIAVVSRRDTGEVVGFNAMLALDVQVDGRPVRVVHAGLCMVDPTLRSKGLCLAMTAAPALLAFVRNRFRSLWFTNVTQVPAVAGVFTTALADVHPAPGRTAPPSPAHTTVVREMVANHRAAFGVGDDAELDAERSVIRNAYTGGSDWLKKSFDECPRHRDVRYNAWCRELLDYERGDDVIQAGRMTLVQWAKVVVRFVRSFTRRRRPATRRAPNPCIDLSTRGAHSS
jgi:hypothetical protein